MNKLYKTKLFYGTHIVPFLPVTCICYCFNLTLALIFPSLDYGLKIEKGFQTDIHHNLTQEGNFPKYHAQPLTYNVIYATSFIIFSTLFLKGLA